MNIGSAVGKEVMASTPHPLATKAALDILRSGGNAVDAAIAANAALAVLLPDQCGLGGDLFAIVTDPTNSAYPMVGINGSGAAPKRASIEEIKRLGCVDMPQTGPLSITVPGAVGAWGEMSRRWGKLPWHALFNTPYNLAVEGFEVTHHLCQSISASIHTLIEAGASSTYLADNKPLEPGARLVQRALRKAIDILRRFGSEAFYSGQIADAIAETVQALGGFLDKNDLAQYSAEIVELISTKYRDYEIYTLPANSRGPILLSILDQLQDGNFSGIEYQSSEIISNLLVAIKNALTIEAFLCDPRVAAPDWENPLSRNANPEMGTSALPPLNLKGDTIAECIVDQNGMAVSLIESVYHDFGSGVYVQPMGFFLQNRGASFTLNKQDKNCLLPGKRPVHTLTPAMATHNQRLNIALGTRGGGGQPQTLAQILVGMIDYQFDVQQAVENPRWIYGDITSARRTDGLVLESRIEIPDLSKSQLCQLPLQWTDPYSVKWMGCAQAIQIDDENHLLYGGADPRGGGLADGF